MLTYEELERTRQYLDKKRIITEMFDDDTVQIDLEDFTKFMSLANEVRMYEERKNNSGRYWNNVCKMFEKQRRKGIHTYGKTLEENDSLSIKERIEMAQEEAIDFLVYLEHIKSYMEDKK